VSSGCQKSLAVKTVAGVTIVRANAGVAYWNRNLQFSDREVKRRVESFSGEALKIPDYAAVCELLKSPGERVKHARQEKGLLEGQPLARRV
jgi:hypothetical protein